MRSFIYEYLFTFCNRLVDSPAPDGEITPPTAPVNSKESCEPPVKVPRRFGEHRFFLSFWDNRGLYYWLNINIIGDFFEIFLVKLVLMLF